MKRTVAVAAFACLIALPVFAQPRPLPRPRLLRPRPRRLRRPRSR